MYPKYKAQIQIVIGGLEQVRHGLGQVAASIAVFGRSPLNHAVNGQIEGQRHRVANLPNFIQHISTLLGVASIPAARPNSIVGGVHSGCCPHEAITLAIAKEESPLQYFEAALGTEPCHGICQIN